MTHELNITQKKHHTFGFAAAKTENKYIIKIIFLLTLLQARYVGTALYRVCTVQVCTVQGVH